MLLSSNHSVKEMIIETLTQYGPLTGPDLLAKLATPITKQSLYKELRALLQEGLVIKVESLFSLRLAWVLNMQELSQRMYQNTFEKRASLWLPAPREKKSWILPDLPRALSLWSHISMAIFRLGHSKLLLEWAPHAWYHLISSDAEQQFQDILKREQIGFYLIVGNDTPLDRSYQPYHAIAGREISFAPSPFEKFQSEYFSVIGDYIIRVYPPIKLARTLHQIYMNSKKPNSDTLMELGRLLRSKAKTKINVIHNKEQAAKLTRKFKDFFGKLI